MWALLGAGAGSLPLSDREAAVRRQEPVLISALLAVSLHASLLAVPMRNEATSETQRRPGGPRAISMQLLSLGRDAAAQKATQVQGFGRPSIPFEQPDDAVAQSEAVDHRLARLLNPPMAPAAPAALGMALRLPGVLGDDDFFARNALDIGPYPTQPVMIDYPPDVEGGGTHTSELALFIDENGKVIRMRVEGHALPSAMEEAARRAFMGTVFSPGQVEGLPVRSRIKVEVVFEEGPSAH